jgi:hypothetical protein
MNSLGQSDITHAIQLALAPVFLLTAIAAMLGVMTGRLARILDRARLLETHVDRNPDHLAAHHAELVLVARRARLVSWAIALCTTTALLIAAVVATLFLSAFLGFEAPIEIALLFVAAMLSMIAALSLFLHDVFLSTYTLRFNGATLRELSRRRHRQQHPD